MSRDMSAMKPLQLNESADLRILPGRAITPLVIMMLLLTAASVMGQYYKFFVGRDRYLVGVFDLNGEWNIPTIYAAFCLLISSLLSGSIGVLSRNVADMFYRHWFALAGLFLGMAVDELLQMHEKLNGPLRLMFNAKGVFYYAWVIPGILLVIGLGLFFRSFLVSLSRRTRGLMTTAGILYVGGVLGVEMIGAAYIDNVGVKTFTYAMITTCEEVLEMVGILVFLYAALGYLGETAGEVRINFLA